jgi:hypothetical protein
MDIFRCSKPKLKNINQQYLNISIRKISNKEINTNIIIKRIKHNSIFIMIIKKIYIPFKKLKYIYLLILFKIIKK